MVLLIKLVYPKKNSNELRLYMNETIGFRPRIDEVWYVFNKKNILTNKNSLGY